MTTNRKLDMIIESILGGSVIVMTAIGLYSSFRRIQRSLAAWLNTPPVDHSPLKAASCDPTPSFTVDLVRTVLEHQSSREDQHRRELTQILIRMATANGCDVGSHATILNINSDALPPHVPTVMRAKSGVMSRTFRRLIPAISRRPS